jgi:hypothetical protein
MPTLVSKAPYSRSCACSEVQSALENRFDQNPGGPYGFQAPMRPKGREVDPLEAIVGKYPDRTRYLGINCQNDVHIRKTLLNRLGDEICSKGSDAYIQALTVFSMKYFPTL